MSSSTGNTRLSARRLQELLRGNGKSLVSIQMHGEIICSIERGLAQHFSRVWRERLAKPAVNIVHVTFPKGSRTQTSSGNPATVQPAASSTETPAENPGAESSGNPDFCAPFIGITIEHCTLQPLPNSLSQTSICDFFAQFTSETTPNPILHMHQPNVQASQQDHLNISVQKKNHLKAGLTVFSGKPAASEPSVQPADPVEKNTVKFLVQWMQRGGEDPVGANALLYPEGNRTVLLKLNQLVTSLEVDALIARTRRGLALAPMPKPTPTVPAAPAPSVSASTGRKKVCWRCHEEG